jgi:hypothetical protein
MVQRFSSLLSRIRILATGRLVWEDLAGEPGEVEVEYVDWPTRWAIAGIHSANWHWVRRWGKQKCGCTINPITRRRVLISMSCPKTDWPFMELDDEDVWDDDYDNWG